MKKYKHAKEKKATDRVSFYIALSICMLAVGMAVWSAYTTLSDTQDMSDSTYFSSLSTENAPAAREITGMTEAPTAAPTAVPTAAPTQPPTEQERRLLITETRPPEKERTVSSDTGDPLQAVLKVADSLVYPVKSHRIVKPYSEDSVYNDTLKDYRAHTGCDFAAEQGENVYAMCGGTVRDISVSELYGVIIEEDCGDFTIYYCGLDSDIVVEKGDEIAVGDTVGTVGHIPSESGDETHVHIEIRVGDKLIDPLSVIGSDN